MKILDLVTTLNKKVVIRDDYIMRVKKYYVSLYRANMLYLYDRGYISDPTYFDRKEILGNIVDLGIKDMTSVSGAIELNADFVGYALCRNTDNEDVSDFLSVLHDVLKYREISINIDKFYDSNGFTLGVKKKLGYNILKKGCRYPNKTGLEIDEGVIKCFTEFNKTIDFVSIREDIYNLALKELGIEDNSPDSLFVKGLSREDEIAYSNIILNGLVKLDGVYAKKLQKWLLNNKWSGNTTLSYQKEGLYDWIIIMKSYDILDAQSALLKKLSEDSKEVVGVREDGFYIAKSTDFKYPVGVFTVCSGDEDTLLPEINMVGGYTGEVYSLDYLNKHKLHYVGCPIELYVNARSRGYFVDKEQTEMADSVSWFKYEGVNVSFDGSKYREEVFLKNSKEDILFKLLGDAEDGVLIGTLPYDYDFSCIDSIKKLVISKL